MSAKRFCVAVLSVVVMLVAASAAQDEKNEIGGILGRDFISNEGIKNAAFSPPIIAFGKGLTAEAMYGRKFYVAPVYSIAGELLAVYNWDEDLNAGQYGHAVVPIDYKAFFVTPAARVNLFPTTAVSPWVSLGVGFGHFTENKMLDYSGVNPGKAKTGAVIEGGLGLDVKVWRRLVIRGEVRDFWSPEPDFPLADTGKSRQHNFLVGGGAFWRF